MGELLGQPQQRRRLAASTAQPGRVNGTQFDLSAIDAGLGANAAAACTPSVACNASWALPAAAVVDIYAINARGGVPVSMGLCTGAPPGVHVPIRRKGPSCTDQSAGPLRCFVQ